MGRQNFSLRLEWKFSHAASHDNQLNSVNWRYLPLPQHAPEPENRGTLHNLFFSREGSMFESPSSSATNPWSFLFRSWKEPPPPYKLSRALRRKNLCGRYPNCLPTSWTDTGWVNTTGFWLLCLQEHGEPPVTNAYVFGCFSASRCQISYPWLHTFSGYRLISSSEVHRGGCTPQYLGQYCWDFFFACLLLILRSLFCKPRCRFYEMGCIFLPLSCCYTYIFPGYGSRRLLDKLQRNFFLKVKVSFVCRLFSCSDFRVK